MTLSSYRQLLPWVVGTLIFLTLERRLGYQSQIVEAGEEQLKYVPFKKRVERMNAELKKKHRRFYVYSFIETWALVIMFSLLLTSISMVIIQRDPVGLSDSFVASLAILFLRILLHGLR